ncbi:MAG TPA: hypothetical protein VJ865_13255 [Gemmatimonadaceae bacterium]|nr:hypothetical protein [Gemmatimonadaceae bacterium]
MAVSRLRYVSIWLSALVLAGCVKPRPENQKMQLGQDVLVSGSAPTIYNDSLGGDAIMAGGDINFQGTTGGDFVGAGGHQDIRGHVHGSLRAAGGGVVVSATVDRNATIGGGDVSIDSLSVIGQNAYLIGGSIHVRGAVRGGLLATGGDVELNGPIGQDVEVASGTLTVGPRAQIAGSLRYRVKGKVNIDPAAKITGKVTVLPVSKGPGPFSLLWIAGVLLMGVVVILLVPRFIAEAAVTIDARPLRAVLTGLIVAFLWLIAIIVAAITVVGLPLALLAAGVWLVVVAISGVPVAVWLGGRIMHARTVLGRQGPLVNFFIGALIFLVIGVIPVIGNLIQFIAGCIGFGAVLMTAWAAREAQLV